MWQATDLEPEDWMLEITSDDRNWNLDVLAVRFGGAPSPVLIEAIEIVWMAS